MEKFRSQVSSEESDAAQSVQEAHDSTEQSAERVEILRKVRELAEIAEQSHKRKIGFEKLPYSAAEMAKDEREIEARKASIAKKDELRGDSERARFNAETEKAAEAVITAALNNGIIFPDTYAVLSYEYDDLMRNTDTILDIFESEDDDGKKRKITATIDTTCAINPETFMHKMFEGSLPYKQRTENVDAELSGDDDLGEENRTYFGQSIRYYTGDNEKAWKAGKNGTHSLPHYVIPISRANTELLAGLTSRDEMGNVVFEHGFPDSEKIKILALLSSQSLIAAVLSEAANDQSSGDGRRVLGSQHYAIYRKVEEELRHVLGGANKDDAFKELSKYDPEFEMAINTLDGVFNDVYDMVTGEMSFRDFAAKYDKYARNGHNEMISQRKDDEHEAAMEKLYAGHYDAGDDEDAAVDVENDEDNNAVNAEDGTADVEKRAAAKENDAVLEQIMAEADAYQKIGRHIGHLEALHIPGEYGGKTERRYRIEQNQKHERTNTKREYGAGYEYGSKRYDLLFDGDDII